MTTATPAQMELFHRTFGGDPAQEQALCDYVQAKFGCLIHHLPDDILNRMLRQPGKVREAVKKFQERRAV